MDSLQRAGPDRVSGPVQDTPPGAERGTRVRAVSESKSPAAGADTVGKVKQVPDPTGPERRRSHYRGERRPVMVRLPQDTARLLSAEALHRGVSASDVAGDLIAAGLAGTTHQARERPLPTEGTAVDLFAGAGGFGLGLTRAGFDVRLAVEMDPAAAIAHALNVPGTVMTRDIRTVTDTEFLNATGLRPGELDLLVGGVPCQGFSRLGSRDVLDPRNDLFLELLRAARVLRPRAVVVENVPGMLDLDGGAALRSMLGAFAGAGYRASCAELLAAQHGVPQLRHRLIVVAFRDDVDVPTGHGFPEPSHGGGVVGDLMSRVPYDPVLLDGLLTTRDAIGDLPAVGDGQTTGRYGRRPSRPFQVEARTGPDGRRLPGELLHDHRAVDPTPIVAERIRHVRPGEDWRALPHHLLQPSMQRAHRGSHTSRYRRMTWDTTPRTVTTHFGDPRSGAYLHPEEHRTITPREGARIQGFPDWVRFHGTVGDIRSQIGNAVPVPLARAFAAEIAACLDGRPHAGPLDGPFRRRPVSYLDDRGRLRP